MSERLLAIEKHLGLRPAQPDKTGPETAAD
jgi:hypothetical protein